jgi:hypothetical protein
VVTHFQNLDAPITEPPHSTVEEHSPRVARMPAQKTTHDSGSLTLPSPVAITTKMPVPDTTWNTSHLGLRLGADALAAASASVLVAPIICVIDR